MFNAAQWVAAGGPYTITDPYFDDDGYATVEQQFIDGATVFWHAHMGGWEAFKEGEDEPIYYTGEMTAPQAEEYWEVYERIYGEVA